MDIPSNYIDKFQKKESGPRSERDELIQRFTDRLNQARLGTRYKPLEARVVAVKLSHIPTGDLWAFWRQCEAARSFYRFFWWAVRTERV